MEKENLGLCNRCEHRIAFIENNQRTRFECGNINSTVNSCYAYIPVLPIKLTKSNKNDVRSVGLPPMLAPRYTRKDLSEYNYTAVIDNENDITYYAIPNNYKIIKKSNIFYKLNNFSMMLANKYTYKILFNRITWYIFYKWYFKLKNE
jgi:hypothetical protein